MTVYTKRAVDVFAPTTAGGAARGADMAEAQTWGIEVERFLNAFQAGGGIIFETKEQADTDLVHAANTMAWVMGDATMANNGVYQKLGASGAGSWKRLGDLPYDNNRATNIGAGTANAIIATTPIPVSESQLIRLNITAANTASPVTVQFNGGAVYTIKTASGNDVVAGGLVPNMILAGYISGATFRLLSDQASAAIQAAAEAAAAAALAAVPNAFPLTRTALKALDTATITSAYLKEAGREGQFIWTAGDFSAIVAADTQEGVYVKADAVAATAGAWVRVTPDARWHSRMFGLVEDNVSDVSPAAIAMINLSNLVKPAEIKFGPAIFNYESRLPEWATQIKITGSRGGQGTIHNKKYVEATTGRGLFAFSDWGFTLEDMDFAATAGSGGSFISAVITAAHGSPALGRTHIRGVKGTASNADYCLYINGSNNNGVGGPGYRGTYLSDVEFLGAVIEDIHLDRVHHLFGTNVLLATNGGGQPLTITASGKLSDGTTDAYCDDIHIEGIIGGTTSLSKVQRSSFYSPISGDILNDAACTGVMWHGAYVSGTLQHNWTKGSRYITTMNMADRATAYLNTGLSNVTGDGTEAQVIFDTYTITTASVISGTAGDPTKFYDISTGRYTAACDGFHSIKAQVTLSGIAAGHTRAELILRQYTSAGVELTTGQRFTIVNPSGASAPGGYHSMSLAADIFMAAGQYVTVSVKVSNSTKVVGVIGTDAKYTRFEAALI